MKIKGQIIHPPQSITVVVPREIDGEHQDIIFMCAPVMDYTAFDALVEEPTPPLVSPINAKAYHDTKDTHYLQQMEQHGEKRFEWLILESLKATPGLTWDSVAADDPDTWKNYLPELEETFTARERMLIIQGVTDANMPSEDKQKEAMERFTSSQVVQEGSHSSQKEEHASTPSGGPVSE